MSFTRTPIGTVNEATFSPDGKLLATASDDGTARVVAVDGGRELARVKSYQHSFRAVVFSPDGKLFAAAGGIGPDPFGYGSNNDEGIVLVVAVDGGQEVARIAHDGPVNAVAFSPDGKLLATASGRVADFLLAQSNKGTARILAVDSGQEVARIAHDGPVNAVAFSPDGKLLATASNDTTARIIAVDSGQEVARIAHDGPVNAVAVSPDGKLLATASADRTTRLWSTDVNDMLRRLCTGVAGRNLSPAEWRRRLGDLPWQSTCASWPTPVDDPSHTDSPSTPLAEDKG
jgi:WD40 repeat protein